MNRMKALVTSAPIILATSSAPTSHARTSGNCTGLGPSPNSSSSCASLPLSNKRFAMRADRKLSSLNLVLGKHACEYTQRRDDAGKKGRRHDASVRWKDQRQNRAGGVKGGGDEGAGGGGRVWRQQHARYAARGQRKWVSDCAVALQAPKHGNVACHMQPTKKRGSRYRAHTL